jgi:hypothetical protein
MSCAKEQATVQSAHVLAVVYEMMSTCVRWKKSKELLIMTNARRGRRAVSEYDVNANKIATACERASDVVVVVVEHVTAVGWMGGYVYCSQITDVNATRPIYKLVKS